MRRVIPLFFLCCLLLLIGAIPHIVRRACVWELSKVFGEKVHYQKCAWEGRTLHFEEVTCSQFTVQHLKVALDWPLHVRLVLDHPTLGLKSPFQAFKAKKALPISWEMEVIEGQLGNASRVTGRFKGSKEVPLEGFLRGENLDANQHLALFFLPGENLELQGTVDLMATYDGASVDMELVGRSMRLLSPSFEMDVPACRAFYRLDVASGHQTMTLPIEGGSYKDRLTELQFLNTCCQVEMADHCFKITQVTSECEGVVFKGELDLTCVPQRSHLKIAAPHVKGQVSSVKKILEKICHRSFWGRAIEGQFVTMGSGLDFEMIFGPQRQILATLEARVSRGDAAFDVTYCHTDRKLLLSNLCGSLVFGKDLALRNVDLVFSHFPEGDCQFHLDIFKGNASWGHLCGAYADRRVALSDESFLGRSPLQLHVQREDEGIAACGQLCGLKLDLHPTSSSTWEGKIDCDLADSLELLPEQLRKFVQLFRVGPGYSLEGRFSLDDQGASFEGNLLGKQVSLLGYWWDKLEAHAFFTPRQFKIQNILLHDPAGHVEVNQIQGKKGEELWEFQVPLIRIDFLRPSKLRRTDGRVQKERPFTIIRGEAHHLVGNSLGKGSWTGLGSFTFNNHLRRNSLGTPFELPDQILGKLGLDPSSLIPSVGRIMFYLHDGKMILSDFDEVYSRARRSQFFLTADSSSYIDLDGHLHLRLRTKHYNLLFKLTENLTIGVDGTLDNPQYSLQKASRQRPDIAMGM